MSGILGLYATRLLAQNTKLNSPTKLESSSVKHLKSKRTQASTDVDSLDSDHSLARSTHICWDISDLYKSWLLGISLVIQGVIIWLVKQKTGLDGKKLRLMDLNHIQCVLLGIVTATLMCFADHRDECYSNIPYRSDFSNSLFWRCWCYCGYSFCLFTFLVPKVLASGRFHPNLYICPIAFPMFKMCVNLVPNPNAVTLVR